MTVDRVRYRITYLDDSIVHNLIYRWLLNFTLYTVVLILHHTLYFSSYPLGEVCKYRGTEF
jgi:hypothetical protein